MIGIILTGHANFASGLTSSLELITGVPTNYFAVDFLTNHSTDDLANGINTSISKLKENGCSEILIFSDLLGGSPFKIAVETKFKSDIKIEVLAGTNLGMLIECTMTKDFVSNLDELVEKAIDTGKQQVQKYEFVERTEDVVEEGI